MQLEDQRLDSDSRPSLAIEWARLRKASPLFGDPSESEAVEQLKEFLQ